MNYHAITLQALRFPCVEQHNAAMSVDASVGLLEIQVSEALLVPRMHSLNTAIVSRKQVSACVVLATGQWCSQPRTSHRCNH